MHQLSDKGSGSQGTLQVTGDRVWRMLNQIMVVQLFGKSATLINNIKILVTYRVVGHEIK